MREEEGGARRTEEAAMAQLTGQVRRSLSLVAARATARCLLERLRGPDISREEELEGPGAEEDEQGAQGTCSGT